MRGSVRLASAGALAVTAALAPAGVALADDSPPANLGNGLSRLVQPPKAVGKFRFDQKSLAIRDRQGRVLVDVYGRPGTMLAAVRQGGEAHGMKVVAQSSSEHAVEGFVAIGQVEALAGTAGIASVSQALLPRAHVGAATSQGVHAQRVDQVPGGIDGRGITVGALSDTYDAATETVDGDPLTVHADDDIRTGDLPKDGVTVLEEGPADGATDEGRAMLQIIHDVAPRAKECFATAFSGELQFADNIRALADPSGPCAADVITDDVGYFDEPMFGDGVISDAVDDVAAQGVQYFSAAANGSSQQAYQAPFRFIAPDKPGDASNINLDGVDPALYAGGFQDFDPGAGVDVAQDLTLGGNAKDGGTGVVDLQWDDPLDPNGSTLSDPLVSKTGETTTAAPTAVIPFDGTAGDTIRGFVDAIPSGTTDFVLTLKDPSGAVLQEVDTGTSPEAAFQTLAETGTYTFEISGFTAADVGPFTFDVRKVISKSRTTTDLNVLLFDADGNFLGPFADLNQFSGRPMEIGGFTRPPGRLQLVITKANTDEGTATQLRYQLEDDLQYSEYDQPLAPSIFGHPTARGANAVAAYDPFRPLLPEDYTSVGGNLPILFDSKGDRLPRPDIRRKPDIAATDLGNTTFFVSDSLLDPDEQPNFGGTSAAAPHAAGIAALALQARGGRRSLSPAAMKALLRRSAFRHDLDPNHSEASTGGLTITADGQQGRERSRSAPLDENPGSQNNPQFFRVQYSGPGAITSITFDGAGANPTGLGRGDRSDGIVFDPRPFVALPALGGPELWQQGFPFTVGAVSPGIDPASVTAQFAGPGVGQASNQQFQQMTVRFPDGALTGGRSVGFGIDRDEATTAFGVAQDGNSADALGAGVLFPEGTVARGGLTYRAVTSTGRVLTGTLRNRIGAGFSPVDGFGYINAEAAVGGPRR